MATKNNSNNDNNNNNNNKSHPVVESTPLIQTPTTESSRADEENVIGSSSSTSNNNHSPSPTTHKQRRRWQRSNSNSVNDSAAIPSWAQAFKEISPFLRPTDTKHRRLAFLSLLTVLIEKVITVLPPLAIRHAVDAISNYSTSSSMDDTLMKQQTAYTVTMSILVYFLLRTINAAVSAAQSVTQRAVSLDAEQRFATALFQHLQMLGASYHLERHAGELLRVLSRGSDAISTIIDSLWFNLLPTFFEAAVVSAVFWKLLGIPSIAWTTVASVALYLMYTIRVTNTRLEQRRKVLERSEDVGRIETETLVNYETVVMFGREKKEVEEYDMVRKEYTQERVNMLGLFACLQLGQQSIRLAGTCIGLFLAGRATVYGTGEGNELLSPGSFVVVQLYIQQLFQPLTQLGFTYRQLSEALTDLEKAVKMLKSKPLVEDEPDAVEWNVALEEKHKADADSEDRTKGSDSRFRFRFGRHQQQQKAQSQKDISGDIIFDNVSFHYKVKSQRKSPADTDSGKIGKRGFGRRSLWGGRGRAVWNGSGGANIWIKDAKKESALCSEVEEEKVKVGGIDKVSFHIPAGRTAALVGPSKLCFVVCVCAHYV